MTCSLLGCTRNIIFDVIHLIVISFLSFQIAESFSAPRMVRVAAKGLCLKRNYTLKTGGIMTSVLRTGASAWCGQRAWCSLMSRLSSSGRRDTAKTVDHSSNIHLERFELFLASCQMLKDNRGSPLKRIREYWQVPSVAGMVPNFEKFPGQSIAQQWMRVVPFHVLYITYISVSIPTPWAVAGPHRQLVSVGIQFLKEILTRKNNYYHFLFPIYR